MPRKYAPRLAGRALVAVARSLRAPVAGRAMARLIVRQLGLAGFRAAQVSDAVMRPAVGFRPGMRPPDTAAQAGPAPGTNDE